MSYSTDSSPAQAEIAADPPTSKGTRRKLQILEAAEECFGRLGYWSATTAEIAEASGITQSALYRYFPNKRALFVATLALRQSEIVEAIAGAMSAPCSTRERIERIGEATVELARRYPNMSRLRVQAVVVAGQDEEIRRVVSDTIDTLARGHRALFDAAKADGSLPPHVDSEILAATFSSLATQLYTAIVLDHPMQAVADRLLPGLLRMVDPPREEPGA